MLMIGVVFVLISSSGFRLNSLSITQNGVQHNFLDIMYFGSTPTLTGISSSIVTPHIVSPSFDSAVSDWIAVYAQHQVLNPDGSVSNNGSVEFMQVGVVDHYYTSPPDPGQPPSGEQGPYAFWATLGPVNNTDCSEQDFANLTAGSVHSYRLAFDGNGWQIWFDNQKVQYIAYPYRAPITDICQEDQCATPNDPGSINSGIVSFTNLILEEGSNSYPFLAFPGSLSSRPPWLFAEQIDSGNNGISMDSASTVRMGWGLPQNIYDSSPFGPPSSGTRYALTVIQSAGGQIGASSGNLPSGATMSIWALPDSGYKLKEWLLDGQPAGTQDRITVTMTADHTLSAIFVPISGNGNGYFGNGQSTGFSSFPFSILMFVGVILLIIAIFF